MKSFFLPVAAVASFLCISSGSASATDAETVRNALMRNTGLAAESITPAPVTGLWEAIIQDRLFYIDENAEYVLAGSLINARTKENLTKTRLREWARESWSKWPRQDAVKQVFGDGSREVVVFSDANCTFCRSMERVFEEVGNLTVYTFVTPMIRGKQNNYEIVCSSNPSKAWGDWMRRGITPPVAASNCDDSVLDRNLSLAGRYNITGAPTFFFSSGDRMTGAVNADQFRSILAELKKE